MHDAALGRRAREAGRGEGVALLLLFVVPAFISTNILAARLGADTIPPAAFTFWRWLLAAILVLPIVASELWRKREALGREWRDIVLLGAIGMGISSGFVYVGAETTTATNIGLIYTLSPVFIVVLSMALFGERLSAARWLGIGLAFLGVLIIVAKGDPAILAGLRFVAGDLWIVGAALGWAIYSIALKRRGSAFGTLARFCLLALGGCVALLPFLVAEHAGGRTMPFDAKTVGVIALAAIPAGILAYSTYAYVIGRLGPSRAGVILYLNPLCASFYGWALLGERLQWFHLAGALLLLGGVYLATRRSPARP